MAAPALPKTPSVQEASNAWTKKLARAVRGLSDEQGNVSLDRARALETSESALAAWGDNIVNYLRATGRAEAAAEEIIRSGQRYASRHFGRAAGTTGKVSLDRAARQLPADLKSDFLALRGRTPSAGSSTLDVRLSTPDEGYSLSRIGDLYRIAIDTARAPARGQLTLKVDGHELSLSKGPGGLSTYDLPRLMPVGYGGDEVSRSEAPGRQVVTLRIARDSAGSLTETRALGAARTALISEAKRMMREDGTWRSYFPTTWNAAEADGIMEGIRGFPAGEGEDGEVHRHTATFLFTGRGPYGLYSEVSVDKASGETRRAYIEID